MKRKANKAFTLIELLVVVAIIGILAAVGVTTFGGFQDKAKIASSKAIHKGVQKKLAAEIVKCSLGDAKIFNDVVACPTTASAVVTEAVKDGIVFSDKNPWGTGYAVKSGNSYVSGQTSLNAINASTIGLKTCTSKTADCGTTANQLTDTITVE